jgi:ATP-dependent RNA helicase RhlE
LILTFQELGLAEPLLRAVATEGYDEPTPIQAQAIPHVIAGRDLFGSAQTGTGKTAAFALPILHRLHAARPNQGTGRRIRALVLSPTRELAAQIAESFCAYGRNTPLRNAVIFGGVNQFSQVKALRNGVDIVVATPGRLLDLMNQGHVDLKNVEILVLDEADRMLDLGFMPDVKRIVARLSAERQTLLFSATMPEDIRRLASSILRDPLNIHVAPVAAPADRIDQAVYHVSKKDKPALLRHVLARTATTRALVFTRTKRGADKVVKDLLKAGVRSAAIHGNKSQAARERALGAFRSNRLPVLVATDIAARGIDVDGISHVVNYDVPHEAETYVHRIGRTARAGSSGIALSFCDVEERRELKAIERLIRCPIKVLHDHPSYESSPPLPVQPAGVSVEDPLDEFGAMIPGHAVSGDSSVRHDFRRDTANANRSGQGQSDGNRGRRRHRPGSRPQSPSAQTGGQQQSRQGGNRGRRGRKPTKPANRPASRV